MTVNPFMLFFYANDRLNQKSFYHYFSVTLFSYGSSKQKWGGWPPLFLLCGIGYVAENAYICYCEKRFLPFLIV